MTDRAQRSPGRPKGSPNKATKDIRAAAMEYTDAALARLAHLMHHAESEVVRAAAANALLDRAHGRPAQAITGADEAPLIPVPEIRIIQLVGVSPQRREPEAIEGVVVRSALKRGMPETGNRH